MSLPADQTTSLAILATPIRRDAEGRYCLNDCHKAAGGEQKNQPANWFRLGSTQALVEEMDRSSEVRSAITVTGGLGQGTFVAKELVYAYAMWISPAFHLTVIRAFDGQVSARVAASPIPKVASTFRGYFSISRLAGLDRNQSALSAARATKADVGFDPLERLGITHLLAPQQAPLLTPTDLGKRLGGKSAIAVNQLMQERGLQVGRRDLKDKTYWEPTEAGTKFAVFLDTGKKNSDGTPVRQLKWNAGVLEALGQDATVLSGDVP